MTKTKPTTVFDYLLKIKERYTANAPSFQQTFRIPLRKFWNGTTGFDVIAFDDWLEAGERSTEEVVRERYGEPAVTLVYKLIGHRA